MLFTRVMLFAFLITENLSGSSQRKNKDDAQSEPEDTKQNSISAQTNEIEADVHEIVNENKEPDKEIPQELIQEDIKTEADEPHAHHTGSIETNELVQAHPSSSAASTSYTLQDTQRVEQWHSTFRDRLHAGTWVEVYSFSLNDWVPAMIEEKFTTEEGEEKIIVSYHLEGLGRQVKTLKRESSRLRPSILTNHIVIEKSMFVLSQIPENDVYNEDSWEFTFQKPGTRVMQEIDQPTGIYCFPGQRKSILQTYLPGDAFAVLIFKHASDDLWALASLKEEHLHDGNCSTELLLLRSNGIVIRGYRKKVNLVYVGKLREKMTPRFDNRIHTDYLATHVSIDKQVTVAISKILRLMQDRKRSGNI